MQAFIQSLMAQAELHQHELPPNLMQTVVERLIHSGDQRSDRAPSRKQIAAEFSRQAKVTVRRMRLNIGKIKAAQLPLTFKAKDGRIGLLAKLNEQQALVMWAQKEPAAGQTDASKAAESQPEVAMLTLAELHDVWQGSGSLKGGFHVGHQVKIKQQHFDISWFIPAFAKHKKLLSEVLLFSFFMQCLALITPLFFQVVMDKVLVAQRMATLDVLVIAMIVFACFEMLLKGLREYQLAHTSNRIDIELGDKLMSHLLHLPLLFFKSRNVGTIVMRVRELSSVREFLTGAGLTLIIDLGFSIIFFGVLYFYSPFLTLLVLASVPCYFILCFLYTPILTKRTENLCGHAAANNAFLTESVGSIEASKSMAIEPLLQRRWDGQIQKFLQANFDLQWLQASYSQLVQLIQKVTMALVLWFGASMVVGLELSIGQLIAFNMIVAHVTQPLVRLADLWQQFVQARVSVERLGDVLNTPSEQQYMDTKVEKLHGQIQFKGITFRYAPDKPAVIDNLSLGIRPGRCIGIVGPSGSGKSTLTKLVQGLYLAEQGQVLIDGKDIRQLDKSSLRQHIGIVLQDSFLFNKSVRDNIALSKSSASLEEVIEAAKLSGAHDFILQLSDGYDTVLSENGGNLSGGQRQRISIARALLNKPPILIFDEATSALDDISQQLIQQNMSEIRKGRTMIMIAHRLSTVRDCDQIVVLEQGQITQLGNHQKLMQQQGRYQDLWQSQAAMKTEQPAIEQAKDDTHD